MSNYQSKGSVSEWNEAYEKFKRLDQAAELANYGRSNIKTFMGDKFGFQHWFEGIDSLYMEGVEKYSTKEQDECEEMIKNARKLVYKDLPIKAVTKNKVIWDEDKLDQLKELLRSLEIKVRRCNNAHGYSTRSDSVSKGLFD